MHAVRISWNPDSGLNPRHGQVWRKNRIANQALAFDLRTVLCDSLLMKVDKATMQASLEARSPYLISA